MALDKQVDMYSVDTGHFYSNHEKYLHDMNCKYRQERNYVKNKRTELESDLVKVGFSKEEIKHWNLYTIEDFHERYSRLMETPETWELIEKYAFYNSLIHHKREKAKESKMQLLTLLKNRMEQNELTDGKDHRRVLREQDLSDANVVSVFESSLTRTIGVHQDELTDDLLVVQIYYFDIFKDISYYGFWYRGEKYRYLTSSAGQIRKKKAVFIKESTWNRIEKTIMCGLTVEQINAHGGNNVNKHLAYLALSNSATDLWEEFGIDRCIVIDDFETQVWGTFDFIDEKDYLIIRKTDYVPVPHTDGAGMILPMAFGVPQKNTMVRLPWIKGLLGVFDFVRFIQEHNYSPVIKDIYGTEHNVIEENIQIILTKSQFKMAKHYDNFEQYKKWFKQYGCTAGRCNIEEDRIKNAKINYQMLQTLTDISDEEIDQLTSISANRIRNICNSEDTIKDILGITPYNLHPTPFQEAVKLYPALLNDSYATDVLREIKDSLLKKYRSGKLEIEGKYTFVLPDFYAACEYWFGHIENPKGLLQDGEVFCWLTRKAGKVDCLRSPHLYKEHAVRFNIANQVYGDRATEIRRWFTTNGIYTSTYDLISKILMFDCDGDKLLLVSDQSFVRIAERNMNGIVPLYYNMMKAEPTTLNKENIYKGLRAAFVGGNIGMYSNHISKIWNHEVFISGTFEEKQKAIDCVKRLCCQNNQTIDYAKTLYKTEFPKEIGKEISYYTNCKLPAFFEYAKDKKPEQVEPRNQSFVNKLFTKIPNTRINTRGLKLGTIDYKKMMGNVNIVCSKEISQLYQELNQQYRYMINMKEEYEDNLHYVACQIRMQFTDLGYSNETIADMLVYYLYKTPHRSKQLLWFAYGKYIVENLKKNLEIPATKLVECVDCGEWFEVPVRSKSHRCAICQHKKDKENKRKYWGKSR